MVSKMAATCRSRLFVCAEAVKSLQVIIEMNKNEITLLGGSGMYQSQLKLEAFIISTTDLTFSDK